jgi:hypothetical protein
MVAADAVVAGAAMVAAGAAASVVVVVAGLVAAEGAVASVVAAAAGSASGSVASGSGSVAAGSGSVAAGAVVARGARGAAHPGERAACAKSHNPTAGLTKDSLSCDRPLAGCEFKVAFESKAAMQSLCDSCPVEARRGEGRWTPDSHAWGRECRSSTYRPDGPRRSEKAYLRILARRISSREGEYRANYLGNQEL